MIIHYLKKAIIPTCILHFLCSKTDCFFGQHDFIILFIFVDPEKNIVMDVLAACRTAKDFSEKVMLLFNRGGIFVLLSQIFF